MYLNKEVLVDQQSKLPQSRNYEAGLRDDEIDLFDLWDDIVSRKWVVVAVFFVCLACAATYLSIAKPVYQVKSVIKPVEELGLVALNVPQLNGIYSLGVDAAYDKVRLAVLSKELQGIFYEENLAELKEVEGLYNEAVSLAQNVSSFNETLQIRLSNDKKDSEKFIEVSLASGSADDAADVLNKYIAFILQRQLMDVKRSVKVKLATRLNKLEYNASLIRDKYYSRKVQRKLQLDEAGRIAKSVGQVDPIYANSDILGSFKPPLYMYGVKALSAEEIALSEREEMAKDLPHGEEHFIEGLSEILFEIDQLKKLTIDYSNIKIARVDEFALAPLSQIKPKKILVLLLACILGVFLGVMAALLVSAYQRHLREI